ncbi:MAG: hypothetical protein HY907_17110 [Deltaproteobacteria bacterium]|nr:hypothetical protein [Deltaproteobacteria bacterium]
MTRRAYLRSGGSAGRRRGFPAAAAAAAADGAPADEGAMTCLPLASCACMQERCVGGIAEADGRFRITTGPEAGQERLLVRECTEIGGVLSCYLEYVEASMVCSESCRPTQVGFACARVGDDGVVR